MPEKGKPQRGFEGMNEEKKQQDISRKSGQPQQVPSEKRGLGQEEQKKEPGGGYQKQ